MYDENPAMKIRRRALTLSLSTELGEKDDKRAVRLRRKECRSEGRHGGPYGFISVHPTSARIAVIFSTASGSTDSFCGWGILRDGAAEDDDDGGGGGGGFLRDRNTIFPGDGDGYYSQFVS